MYKLVIEDDEARTTEVPISRETITIGRKEDNYILLDERNVSRHHARLDVEAGRVHLSDLGSSYGILLNGSRLLGKTQLHPGDHFQVGSFGITLEREFSAGEDEAGAEDDGDDEQDIDTSVIRLAAAAAGEDDDDEDAADDPLGEDVTAPVIGAIAKAPSVLPPPRGDAARRGYPGGAHQHPVHPGPASASPAGRATPLLSLLVVVLSAVLLVSLVGNLLLWIQISEPAPPPVASQGLPESVIPPGHDDLIRAEVYMDLRLWEDAIETLNEALMRDHELMAARRLLRTSVNEQQARQVFERIRELVARGEHAPASALLPQLRSNSSYREEAEELLASAPPVVPSAAPGDASAPAAAAPGAAPPVGAPVVAPSAASPVGEAAAAPADEVAMAAKAQALLHYNAARKLERRHKVMEAIAEYEQAIQLNPSSPQPYKRLGFLYVQLNDEAKACRLLRQAIAAEPGADDLRKIERKVQDLGCKN